MSYNRKTGEVKQLEQLLLQFMNELRAFRTEVNERLTQLENGLQQVNGRLDHVESNLQQVNERLDHMENELQEVKQGQAEIKELLKHHTTLTFETLTNMRKEIRTITNDTQADINLLFREVEAVKRQVNKVEQRLAN